MSPWPFAAAAAATAEPEAPGRRATWSLAGGRRLELGRRTAIMGIVNVTPDSFSDGGRCFERDKAVAAGLRGASEGAAIIDVGGLSTRPGSEPVSPGEEINRVVPVISGIRAKSDVAVSVDTYRAGVARAALCAGADIVNDVSAFRFDADMLPLLAERKVPAIAMHIKGAPRDMQSDPRYDDVVAEVREYLADALERAGRAGLERSCVAIDPGIGFGKTVEHNLALLRAISTLKKLGSPVLVGASRKSFIGEVLDLEVGQRLEGTLAVSVLAAAAGADIVRVHDVAANLRAVRMAEAVLGRSRP